MTFRKTIASDVQRYTGQRSARAFLRLYLIDRGFRPLVPIRLYHAVEGSALAPLVKPILWLWHRRSTRRAGMDIPMRTSFAPGINFPHWVGIVINEAAQIGSNVTLFHGVTLGQADRLDRDGNRETTGAPILEDGVWVGPHAAILGPVRIGRGSRILAGAIVTTDIPPASLVAGNPSRIVRENCAPDIPNPADLS